MCGESVDSIVWKLDRPDGTSRCLSYVLIPQIVFIATDFDLQSCAGEPARLEKNIIRAEGTFDVNAHDDVLICHVREKVLERVADISKQYDALSADQREKIQRRLDADSTREQSRARESWALDEELLRQVNGS